MKAMEQAVVIYFQICIFEPLETTKSISSRGSSMLWFTFKFVSLNHWKQLITSLISIFPGCDLLSNLYLWTIGNNTSSRFINTCKLWFTFKFVSLNHWKQPSQNRWLWKLCCDLLSNLYLWTIGNNKNASDNAVLEVVIYFQICIFEPLETTLLSKASRLHLLWFTFKFVSLNHWKQRHIITGGRSCVVIYFQICIFEPLETTKIVIFQSLYMLWFTFKFVSLNHWKQHFLYISDLYCSCDLLSNLYLWTIGNNWY